MKSHQKPVWLASRKPSKVFVSKLLSGKALCHRISFPLCTEFMRPHNVMLEKSSLEENQLFISRVPVSKFLEVIRYSVHTVLLNFEACRNIQFMLIIYKLMKFFFNVIVLQNLNSCVKREISKGSCSLF